jgi:GAF domain-containing protein
VLRYAAVDVQADSAAFVLSEPGTGLRVVAAMGSVHRRPVVPAEANLAARVISTSEAVLNDDYVLEYRATAAGNPAGQVASAVGVPLRTAAQTTTGALVLGRVTGRHRFTAVDRDQLASFATHGGSRATTVGLVRPMRVVVTSRLL